MRIETWRPSRLQRARKAREWSVKELGERVGLMPGSVRHYEQGRATPQPAVLVRLAEALGVATVDLAPLRPEPTLHELRWHAGLNAAELQQRVGVSRSVLSEQLRGNVPITCPTTLCAALSSPAITVTPDLLQQAWSNSRSADLDGADLDGRDREHGVAEPENVAPVGEETPAPRTSPEYDEIAWTAPWTDDDAEFRVLAGEVRAAMANLSAADLRLGDAVAAMRADGVSWADIGKVLGVTRQAAWQRFARRE